jgi:hypothetical protein
MPVLEGVNRKNFQINTRSWRLLVDFIFDHSGNLIKEDERHGWHEGYGKIISGETANKIADCIDRLIAEEVVERHIIELSIIKMESHFSVEILKKFAQFLRSSGGFDIW